MSREKIEELVNKKAIELTNIYQKDKGYDYCKEYVLNNDLGDIADFTDIDIWYLMKCLYYINNKDNDIEKIEETFESFKPFFELSNIETIMQFIDMTIDIDKAGNIDNVINYLDNKNIFKSAYKLANQVEEDLSFLKKLKDIKKFNNNKEIDMANYFRCYKEQKEEFIKIMNIFKTYRLMLFDMECLDKELENGNKMKDKEKKNFIRKMYKDLYDINKLTLDVNKVKTFVSDEEKKEKQSEKNNNKEMFNLNGAISLLENALEKEEITNAREIVSKIKDLNIKYSVLELISEHNKKYYKEVDEELNYLNQNNKIKYQALLNDYGIINGSYQIDKIMHNRLEDVEEILKIITKYKLSNEQIIKILRNSNLEIVNKIKEYLEKGYLSLEFLIDNNDIFYRNSTKYQTYNSNIEVLNEYNINPCLFFDSIKILFMNNDTFKKNIELLNSYNLLNSLKTTNNYKFLSNNELYISIDKLIELGYENFIEEDLNLLNSEKLLRLEALKAFEIIIDNKEDLDKVLTKKFYISDDELNDYIPNVESLINEDIDIDIEELNKYINGRTYNINGVIISTNKVKRNIENGLTPFKSIIKNSVLSVDEIKILKDELKEKTLRKENI